VTLARRVRDIEPFLAVEVAERAQELERAGIDVVHLEFGEPDFEAPAVVRDALERAIKDGRTRYTHSLGILPLREAIAEHYARSYGVAVSPDQILVTAGTSPAMLLLFGHLLDPGDEVVLSDPYYACYPNFIRYADGRPVYVGVTEEDGFQYRPEAIRERLGPRTRAIVINSPANPTGTVLSPERMAAIGELSRGDGPLIVSDEIYHGLSYEGRDRTILEFTDRAFVLNGFSKAYAMTGWRLGWVVAPRDHIRALQMLYGNFFISTNEFVQWAGVTALRDATDESRRFRAIFDDRPPVPRVRCRRRADRRVLRPGQRTPPVDGLGEPRARASRVEPRGRHARRGLRRQRRGVSALFVRVVARAYPGGLRPPPPVPRHATLRRRGSRVSRSAFCR